jgi:hypothetical protein
MNKEFDCLKMKEEIQAKKYEETKDMTFPELRAYLDRSLANSALWQKLVKRDNAQRQNMAQIDVNTGGLAQTGV